MEHYYQILELDSSWVKAEEAMGTKGKFWVSLPDDKEPWLFKLSRESDGRHVGEHWAEKVAAEVADLLLLPHAEVELATFNNVPGSLSRRFTELSLPGTALAHGNDLLEGLVIKYGRYKQRKQSNHTLGNILRVIDQMFLDPDDHDLALVHFIGYLVLDALILNTDRHHQNWALIRYTTSNDELRGHRMAPSFDHASSLGRNVTQAQLAAWACRPSEIARYARNAPGLIYALSTDTKGLNPIELVRLALRVKPDYVHPWLRRLHTLDPEALAAIVHRVPPTAMSAEQKAFTTALLRHTLSVLQQLEP